MERVHAGAPEAIVCQEIPPSATVGQSSLDESSISEASNSVCSEPYPTAESLNQGLLRGDIFLRVVREPQKISDYTSFGESNWELELRKASRKSGTLTRRRRLDKDGNPNRSFTMASPGTRVFWDGVGYGIIRPDPNKDVKGVSVDQDLYKSGFGKKKYLPLGGDGVIDPGLDFASQLEALHTYLMTKNIESLNYHKINEVIVTVRSEDIQFLFYVDPIDLNKTLYMQKVFKNKFEKELPIFRYSRIKPYFQLPSLFRSKKYEAESVLSLVKKNFRHSLHKHGHGSLEALKKDCIAPGDHFINDPQEKNTARVEFGADEI